MRALGKQLAEELQNETLYLYHSPYRRARASLHEWLTGYVSAKKGKPPVLPSSPPPEEDTYQWEYEVDTIQGLREDSRLRGGDMGRYDSIEEMKSHFCEQQRYGPFFYRFPHGESGADVCDRVTSFLSTFQRERSELRPETNVLIFTHDIVIRMFIKRWFHLTVDTFHQMAPVASGSVCVLSRVDGHSYFRLDEASVAAMHLPRSLNDSNGYRFRNKDFLGSMSLGAPFM